MFNITHLFAKGFKTTRITNIMTCRLQNSTSWVTLSSIRAPTRAIKVHCEAKHRETPNSNEEVERRQQLGEFIYQMKKTF